MNLRKKRFFILTTVFAVVALAGYLNASGFCYSQGRYLADAELFKSAVSYRSGSIRELSQITHPISGDVAAQYIQQHPKCCSVESNDFFMSNGLLSNLLGFKSIWVRLIHELPLDRVALSPKDGRYYEAYVGMTSCGSVFQSTGITRITAN